MNSLEEIESLNHHLRFALNQVDEGVLVIEAESLTPIGPRIVFSNKSIWDSTGYEKSDLIGQPIGLLFDRDFLTELLDKLPMIGSSDSPYVTVKDIHLKNGNREKFEWTITPIRNSVGSVVNYSIKVSAVQSEIVTAKEDSFFENLAKSRLESLQIVSSGIAHDFRNGLVATKLALDLVRAEAGNNAELLKHLDDANLSIEGNAELATQMLAFAHGEEPNITIVNLHGLLKQSARMSTIGNNVQPELSIQTDLWDVRIDSVQMRQVFQNIIINGCQAMPDGGPMSISARNAVVADGNTFNLPAGNYVVIGIRDRGCGIPQESLGKVFDPYFTTKPDGTGIGLASCKQIVERHRGKIMVESAQDVGTEFIIFLPTAGSTVDLPSQESLQPQILHARATEEFLRQEEVVAVPVSSAKRVLIVDDDPQVRKLAAKMASYLGFDPMVAEDGEQAILHVRQARLDSNSYDAVILDLGLPGMGGLEVLREIQNEDASVKVILSTGDPLTEDNFTSDWDGVLSKPYGKDSMERVLSKVLRHSHHQVPS